MFGLSKSTALALLAFSTLAACMEAGLGGGAGEGAPAGVSDGPDFVRDETGCYYEVILGQRFPIVDAAGRQRCASL